MKKLKISMLALLFTVGIGGAVVQNIHAEPKPLDQSYTWSSPQGAFTGTEAQARDHYSCPVGNNVQCARGTAPGVQDLIIKKP